MMWSLGLKDVHVVISAIDSPVPLNPGFGNQRFHEYFSITKDVSIVIYQGSLIPHRNLKELVISIRYVKNLCVVLVLMGEGPLRPKIEQIARRYNISSRIFIREPVPQEELLSWTVSADIGVIPYPAVDLNTMFCTPNKLFEYIQAGLPIIANDLPELRKYVKNTGFGWTTRMESPQDIACALETALDDDEGLKRCREKLEASRHLYSWERERTKFLQIIYEAMDKHQTNELAKSSRHTSRHT